MGTDLDALDPHHRELLVNMSNSLVDVYVFLNAVGQASVNRIGSRLHCTFHQQHVPYLVISDEVAQRIDRTQSAAVVLSASEFEVAAREGRLCR